MSQRIRCHELDQTDLMIQFLSGVFQQILTYSSPKNYNSVIIYSPSCRSKPVEVSFFCWTQKKIILKNTGYQTVAGSHWLP